MKKLLVLIAVLLGISSALAQSYSPVGVSPTEHPVFSWPATANASNYKLYIGQYGADTIYNVSPTQASCTSGTGTCTYDPGVTCEPPAQQGQGVCSQAHTIGWWIEAYDSAGNLLSSPGELMAYIPLAGHGEVTSGNYATNYDFTMDATPCTKWTYVQDFVGQTRRVIDILLNYSGNSLLGLQMFHKTLWTPVNISDLVPTGPNGAREVKLAMETGYSATCAAAAGGDGCDLIGWTFRRHGETEVMPNSVFYYNETPRSYQEVTVPVDPNTGIFDFWWDDGANGIYPAQVNNSNLTGEFINATLIGYCTP